MQSETRIELMEKMIQDILWRKREFSSYEEGYMDAILDINHLDEMSANHILFIQRLYKRLFQKNT